LGPLAAPRSNARGEAWEVIGDAAVTQLLLKRRLDSIVAQVLFTELLNTGLLEAQKRY